MTREQNIKDIKKMRKNYFLFNLLHPKKVKKIKEKFKRIPPSFLEIFDQESYLRANPDVQDGIKIKQFDNALEHFIFYGYDEIKDGTRRIGTVFPFMTEDEYIDANPDLQAAKKNGSLSSAMEHFICWGYKEVLEGKRTLSGRYPFELTDDIIEKIKNDFDEERYLNTHPDVEEAVKEGKIANAWEHFLSFGLNEIRQGKRTIHNSLPHISEVQYVQMNQDIFDALKNNQLYSPFEHFLLHGQHEILSGTRIIPSIKTYVYYPPEFTDEIRSEINNFGYKPLISVVMPVYNVDAKWLKLAIDSLKGQWYNNWELCIADDKSTNKETVEYLKSLDDEQIKVVFLEKNVNISGASNEALKLASGEYVALMDNDDELTPDALYEVVKTINHKDAEFIYSDEDKLELNGSYSDPNFKPDFSPDMFFATNYLSHLGVIKKSLVDKAGGWTIGLEGSQDYDLYLRVLELTNKIVHIPKVLYHWRKIPGSTAMSYGDKSYANEAGKKSLQLALNRRDINAKAEYGNSAGTYRIRYKIIGEPLVSIIIPFKDKPELLDMCINSILNKSTYQNYEIIGMSNNSQEKETFEMIKTLETKDTRVKFYEYNHPFNYSSINNYAVKQYAKGKHLILLNNDIEIITPDWIESMLEFSQRDDVGAIGAKLYYPNDTIQHAGVSIGVLTIAGHNFRHLPRYQHGYSSRASIIQNISAVTAACLMIKKTLYDEVNGMNSQNLQIAFNDIDLCLRLREKNYLNIFTPYCEAYHHESISRGHEDTPEKIKRFREEIGFISTRHNSIYETGDPYYNPNLTLDSEDFTYAPTVTHNIERYIGQEFSETIIKSVAIKKQSHNKVCIFSHFDKDEIIDDYVVYYLEKLSKFFDIVFVSTASGLTNKEIEKIIPYCISYIVKENYGYDFGAWKSGMNFLGNAIENYEWLTLCNDSVYGPFNDMSTIIESMDDNSCDIFSLSENYEIKHHLQSYFISYNKKVFMGETFQSFWNNFKIYEDKATLIKKCEVGFSNKLINNPNYHTKVLAKRYDNTYSNIVQFYWKELIEDGFPFIKIELLKSNPLNINVKDWEKVIQKNSNYPINMIKNHLKKFN